MSSTIMQSLTFITFTMSEWIPKFDIYHINNVWVNPYAKVFDKPRHLTKKKMLIIFLEYTPVTQIILCTIFLMYVATIQCLNHKGQEFKTCNAQFIFLCTCNLARGLAIHTRFDDLYFISRSLYVRIINCKLFLDSCPL